MPTSPAQQARSELGAATRVGDRDRIAAARRNLEAVKLQAHIERVVACSPKLTSEQIERLAALLRGSAAA